MEALKKLNAIVQQFEKWSEAAQKQGDEKKATFFETYATKLHEIGYIFNSEKQFYNLVNNVEDAKALKLLIDKFKLEK